MLFMNVVRTGEFPTVQEIEELGESGTKYTAADVEKLFDKGDLLPPDLIGAIQKEIDDCFIEHMMKNEAPIDKFGSMHDTYRTAISNYKIAMLNAVADWQKKYEIKHGALNVNLQGRIVYAMCRGPDGEAPRPLLTISYITVLDTLLGRIPSTITEVSNYLLILYCCQT